MRTRQAVQDGSRHKYGDNVDHDAADDREKEEALDISQGMQAGEEGNKGKHKDDVARTSQRPPRQHVDREDLHMQQRGLMQVKTFRTWSTSSVARD
jgi:hypothetical protein